MYCIYCSHLLEAYYIGYEQSSKAESQRAFREKLINHLNGDESQSEKIKTAAQMKSWLGRSLKDLLVHPFTKISNAREKVMLLNFWRIYYIFSESFIEFSLMISKDAGIIDAFDRLFNTTTDIDKAIQNLHLPEVINTMRVLSVAFFAVRLSLNAAMIVKHTFLPSEQEKKILKYEPEVHWGSK